MARAPPGRRGHAQHAARVVGQRLEAQVEDVAQVRRQRPGRRVGRRQQLLGEEGVALGARVQASDQAGLGGGAEDAGHLLGELGLGERRHLEALHDVAALLLGEERAQRVLAVQLVAAVGAHDQQALVAQSPQQRGEELEGGAVGPVDVLDGEQQRRLGGEAIQERSQQPEEPCLGDGVAGAGDALVALVGRAADAQLGQQPREIDGRRADQLLEGRRRELAGEAAQGRGDRRVGQPVGAEGQAVAAQDTRAALDREALELAQQARLADARLAPHEHGGRRAVGGSVERRLEALELPGTADELGARDARWHSGDYLHPEGVTRGA